MNWRRLSYVGVIAGAVISVLVIATILTIVSFHPLTAIQRRPPASKPKESTTEKVSLTAVAISADAVERSAADRIAKLSSADADTWDTEKATAVLNQQLTTLARVIEGVEQPTNELRQLVSNEFAASPLLPATRTVRFQSEDLTVRSAEGVIPPPRRLDPNEFAAALRQLRVALGSPRTIRVKFKLFQIDPLADEIQTRIYYEASGVGTSHVSQQNATWNCRWQRDHSQSIKLSRIVVEDYEQAERRKGPLYVDCTRSVLALNRSYSDQILPGIPHWSGRLSREFMTQFGHHGIAVGDVNGDGLDDLYVCDAGGLPNRLFVQQPDGTAVDTSASAGVNLLEDSVSALLIDLDNDGDQDLVVATDPLIHFAENDGNGRFTLRQGYYANTDSYSMAAADFDIDGDLDIYVCGYNARKQDPVHRGLPFPLPYHDAHNGGRNFLLRNEGGFRFTDATGDVGLDSHNTRFSLAAAWDDYDNDNDLDLYVANDFGRNNLYRNDGQVFRDVASSSGVEDHASGMSVAWGDYDCDGWVDLYISNMFSAAGHRVTFQRRFAEGLADETVSHLRRMSRGNTLFRNRGDGTFEDVSEPAGVTMGRWAWASRFSDVNNDSWPDLLITNGYVTSDDQSDL